MDDDEERKAVARAVAELQARKDARDAQRRREDRIEVSEAARKRHAESIWTGTMAALFERVRLKVRGMAGADLITLDLEADDEEAPFGRVDYVFTSPAPRSRLRVVRSFILHDDGSLRTATIHYDRAGRRSPSPGETSIGPIDTVGEAAVRTVVMASLISFADLEGASVADRPPSRAGLRKPRLKKLAPKRRIPTRPSPKRR